MRGEGHGVSVRFALDLEAPVVVLVERVTADVAHLLRTHVGLRQSLLLFVLSFVRSFFLALILSLATVI